MESPLISRYDTQKSEKRVFPGENSMDPDVIEIAPPVNRTSKPKSQSQSQSLENKEFLKQEIIDVDMDEDRDNINHIEGKAHKLNKGKEAIAANNGYIDGDNSSEKSGVPGSYEIVNLDGFGSDLSYVDDDYIDVYHDSMHVFNDNQMYDDEYAILQSHFDNIDIPPGVEAPIPWFPGPGKSKTRVDIISSNQSFPQPQPDPWGVMPVTESSNLQWSAEPLWKNSSSITHVHGVGHPHKVEMSSSWSSAGAGSKHSDKHGAGGWHKPFSSGASSHGPQILPGPIEQYHGSAYGGAYFRNDNKRKAGSNSFVSGSYMHTASEAYPDPATTNWYSQYPVAPLDHPMFFDPYMTEYMLPEEVEYFMQDSSTIQKKATHFGTPSKSSSRNQKNFKGLDVPSGSSSRSQTNATRKDVNEDEMLQKFQQFKKFDMVQDPSDHHYVNNGFSGKQPSKSWSKKIQEEWKILEKDLPDTIFVRVYESRMDLLRAVIVGAEGTPYHDGLFFFDVFFPDNYPSVPPHVYYYSHGLRLNPNLYDNGKVCLSLLNTWSGSQKEMWIPKLSTMLQVLVSIQGLILNAKPYFNEPGYANSSGTLHGEKSSEQYNENTFILSLRTMVYTLRSPPKHFEDFVVGHFFKHARDILVACKAYMDGAQVGCLVKGGVQDVDEGDKSCSEYFKGNVGQYIKPLVDEFAKIGVKDCEKFIPPAQTRNIVTGHRQIRHRLMSPALKTLKTFPLN